MAGSQDKHKKRIKAVIETHKTILEELKKKQKEEWSDAEIKRREQEISNLEAELKSWTKKIKSWNK